MLRISESVLILSQGAVLKGEASVRRAVSAHLGTWSFIDAATLFSLPCFFRIVGFFTVSTVLECAVTRSLDGGERCLGLAPGSSWGAGQAAGLRRLPPVRRGGLAHKGPAGRARALRACVSQWHFSSSDVYFTEFPVLVRNG